MSYIPSFATRNLPLTTGSWRYYRWITEPDWNQGVVILAEPINNVALLMVQAAMDISDPSWAEVVLDSNNRAVLEPFEAVRIMQDNNGCKVKIRSTGSLMEVDSNGTPLNIDYSDN